jgi:hypothetical protein
MKVCYRKSDGLYCDNEGSWPLGYPGDEEFVKGPNVIERFGGEVEDYVVVDVDPEVVPQPWFKMWQDGSLVDDEEKLAAIAQRESEENAAKEIEESVRQKIKDGTATLQDVLEYLKVKDPSLLG